MKEKEQTIDYAALLKKEIAKLERECRKNRRELQELMRQRDALESQ